MFGTSPCWLLGGSFFAMDADHFPMFRVSGRNPAIIPSRGRNALAWKMVSMDVLSASQPKKAEPIPPSPNMSPKNTPEMRPTLSGIMSVAYTTIEENADAMMRLAMKAQVIVKCSPI